MRSWLLICTLGFVASTGLAQVPSADTSNVIALLMHSRNCLYKPGGARVDLDSAVQLAAQAESLSLRLRYPKGIEASLSIFQAAFFLRSKTDSLRLSQATVRQDSIVRKSLIGGAVLIALFTAVLYGRWRTRKKMTGRLKDLTHHQHKLIIEKEWLLREIHHRIKNNLQIIISLLHMQSVRMKDETAIGAFEDIGARVNTISLVHKKLYQESQNMVTIDMRDYIHELVESVREGLGAQRSILFDLDIADCYLDVSQVVPLGLILNEAITNAVKYAFPGASYGESPKVTISLREQSTGRFTLHIADNGVGLPAGFDPETASSLGLQLIRTLTLQLEGSLEISAAAPGLQIYIQFRHQEPNPQNAAPPEQPRLAAVSDK